MFYDCKRDLNTLCSYNHIKPKLVPVPLNKTGEQNAPPLSDEISPGLIAIMVRLVWTLDRNTNVGGLIGAQLGQAYAEFVEVQPRDLFVELLGQHVHFLFVL